jgi:hypothetical protein
MLEHPPKQHYGGEHTDTRQNSIMEENIQINTHKYVHIYIQVQAAAKQAASSRATAQKEKR